MPGAIFFDLDGTLTDPKPGITRSIQHALERLDMTFPHEDELTWCIGPPLRPSLAKLVGEDAADRALAHYRERFSTIGIYENSLYPGVPDLLAGLRGKRLFLATSKPAPYAHRILAHFGIAGFFEQVFGSDMDGTNADKSDLIRHALAETQLSPIDAVMVGDRSHDIAGARQNGMTGLGVLYGYGTEKELWEAGAMAVFATVAELQQGLLKAV